MMREKIEKPLIVFGCSLFSSAVIHCLNQDSNRDVEVRTVDSNFIDTDIFEGCPVYPFEHLVEHCSPEKYEIILPIGYAKINGVRKEHLEKAKAFGFRVASYISSRASIWPDISIGEHVMLFESVILQSYVTIGCDVIIRAGANIGHHTNIGDHSFIASSVVTGGNVKIGKRCWLGLGAVIRNGVSIGDRCFIGMGAVVTEDTEPDGVYVGVPARRIEGKTSLDVSL